MVWRGLSEPKQGEDGVHVGQSGAQIRELELEQDDGGVGKRVIAEVGGWSHTEALSNKQIY